MTVIETTVWIDYLRGIPNAETIWLEDNIRAESVGIIDLILCEVLQGVRDEFQFARVRRELLKLRILPSGGAHFAQEAAKNYRSLRANGLTVRTTIDCLIATVCIMGGHTLLHRDRDYDAFERYLNLKVLHLQPSPPAPPAAPARRRRLPAA